MAFTNLPPNLQDMFYALSDRIAKLETGPNQAMYTASSAAGDATSAYNRASTAVQVSAYTITNPSTQQLTAINTGGITVYSNSATSGPRVVMNSLGIVGYKSSGGTDTPTFSLDATTGDVSMTGTVTATNGNIGGFNLGTTYLSSLNSTSGYRWNSSTGAFYTNTINASGTITAATGIVISTGGGNLSMGTNNINNAGTIGATTVNATTVSSTTLSGTNVNTTNATVSSAATATTSAATNCYITTGGVITRTSNTSSQRYKDNITDINNVDELDPKALYDLPIRAFTYKEGHIPDTDDRYMQMLPGFIAEEMDAIYPIAADYADGNIETWNPHLIIPGLLYLIQEQNQRIKALEAK